MPGNAISEILVRVGLQSTVAADGKAVEGQVRSIGQTFVKNSVAIGAATTAIGVAIVGLTDAAKKQNAALGVTALQLGVTKEEMRDLALATTNVTFPLSEVSSTFDLLARSGMESKEEIAATAIAFDTLGDSIGQPASVVTTTLIPAFDAFNIDLKDAAEYTDMFTHLQRNTTVELSDFSSMLKYIAPELSTMNISMQDSISVLEALADKGIVGSSATREFRTAISGADGDVTKFYEALGLTEEEVAKYSAEIDDAEGYTQKFADAANEQYGMVDKLKQKWSEFSLAAGSALEPLDSVGAAMTAMGPALMGLQPMMAIAGYLKSFSVASSLAAAKTWLFNAALYANPLVWIVAIIVGVVAALYILEKKFGVVTDVLNVFKGAWDGLKEKLFGVEDKTKDVGDAQTDLEDKLKSSGDEVKALEDSYKALESAIKRVKDLTEEYDDTMRELDKANIELIEEQEELAYMEAVRAHGAESAQAQAIKDANEQAKIDRDIEKQRIRVADSQDRVNDLNEEGTEILKAKGEADTEATRLMQENGVSSLAELGTILEGKKAEHEGYAKELEDIQKEEVETTNKYLAAMKEALIAGTGPVWGMVTAYRNWDSITAIVGRVSEEVSNKIADIPFLEMENRIKGYLEGITTKFGIETEAWQGVVSTGMETLSLIMEGQLSETVSNLKTLLFIELPAAFRETFEEVKRILEEKVTEIKTKATEIYEALKQPFVDALAYVQSIPEKFRKAGEDMIQALKDGIVAKKDEIIRGIEEAFGKFAQYLPGSDAKLGPLSHLTASGEAVFKTFAKGMEKSRSELGDTFANAVSTITPSEVEGTFEAALPTTAGKEATATAATAYAGDTFNIGPVSIGSDYDVEKLFQKLQALQQAKRVQRGVRSVI